MATCTSGEMFEYDAETRIQILHFAGAVDQHSSLPIKYVASRMGREMEGENERGRGRERQREHEINPYNVIMREDVEHPLVDLLQRGGLLYSNDDGATVAACGAAQRGGGSSHNLLEGEFGIGTQTNVNGAVPDVRLHV